MFARGGTNASNRIIRIIAEPRRFQSSDGENTEQISKFRRALPQFLAVGVTNSLLFVYGLTLGFPIVVIPAIQLGRRYRNNDLFLSRDEIACLSLISLTCVPVGCALAGFYSEYIGKKKSLQLINIPIIISFLLFHFATSAQHLYLALGLSALSCGLLETPILIYIRETVEAKHRDYLTATGSLFILLGITYQYYISSILHWRMIAAISILFPVVSFILLFFIPESPVWLIRKNASIEGIKSLKWLRGWVSANDIETEFLQIYERVEQKPRSISESKFPIVIKEYLSRLSRLELWYPFTLILFMFFVGHFSGKTTLQTFTVQIFHALKAPLKKFEATLLLNLCDILGVLFCVVLLNWVGKRKLLLISCMGTAVCFFGAGTYAHFLSNISGYAVDNIVSNAANVPNENTITTDNITNIFDILSQKDILNHLNENMKYNISLEGDEDANFTENIRFSSHDGNLTSSAAPVKHKRNINEVSNGITIAIPYQETNNILWLPLILLFGGALFAHMGIRTIPWILIGELCPEESQSYMAGIISGFGFLFGFLANHFFLDMLNTLSLSGTFWFYSAIAIYGTIIIHYTLPQYIS